MTLPTPALEHEAFRLTPVTPELLDDIVRRIVAVAHPLKIILFGSHARCDTHPNSDLDILVIADSDLPRDRRSPPLYDALSKIMIGMDIMVYTPTEVAEWSGARQAFVTTAIREGKVLYENDAHSQAEVSHGAEVLMKTSLDVVKGWIQKAENDLITANLCITNQQSLDTACFHAQQAAEKYLKTYLTAYEIKFPFIHILEKLIDLCVLRDPEFETLKPTGAQLTPYAVDLRYDNSFSPELDRAQEAYRQAVEIKNFVMDRLPAEAKT